MKIGDRIRARRESLGNISQDKLAKMVGYSGRSSINKIELNKGNVHQDMVMKLAKALKTSPAYLMGWVDDPELTHEQILELERKGLLNYPTNFNTLTPHLSSEQSTVPIINLPVIGDVAAGIGAYADVDNYAVDYMPIPSAWLSPNEDYCILKVTGNSMEPEICNGDYALIRCQSDVDSGSIGVVLIDNDSGVIKKIMKYENYVSLVSFNKDYEPRTFVGSDMNRIRFFGVVKKIIREY